MRHESPTNNTVTETSEDTRIQAKY